ncbi:DUF4139 domain-containing protein [Thermodesulforhabdus norvegica]|uniref:DUF4139 domain-containing protein n=1 Tax=Thermodesulforhabdus norvegica TaxID=39841 RepID=A0A1I4T5Q9_9BACT|nr:DUF4139 domain-containing protein [Thermodesulforhabdus norvegica]SFM72019.1 conserved hypothetical protein [Thermodesulforhabdus norvegica]
MRLKKTVWIFAFLISTLSGVLISYAAEIRIEKVLLSPQSATIWGTAYVTVEEDGKDPYFELTLPPQTKPDTLSLKVEQPSGLIVTDLSYELLEKRDEENLKLLAEKIKDLEKEIDLLQAEADINSRLIDTWLGWAQKADSSGNFIAVMEETGKRVKELQASRIRTIHDVELKKRELKRLKETYENLAGSVNRSWRFKCRVSSKSNYSLKPGTQLRVAYSFLFSDAGWKAVYLINGEPARDRLTLTWLAEVWQKSGIDWRDVDLMLATTEPVFNLEPPELPPWNIRPLELPPRSAGSFKLMAVPEKTELPAEAGIKHEKKSGFAVYHVGKRTVRAGTGERIMIENFSWDTDFKYLLRPYVSPWSFIRGKVSLKESVTLPGGNGLYFLDGVFVKSAPFSFHGLEKVFYFGPDRLVTGDLVLKKRETGKEGLIKEKKTYSWEWQFIIRNNHEYPVDLVLEERKPIATDERITVKIEEMTESPQSDPGNPNVWVWNINMPPHHEKILKFAVTVLTPEDMSVDPGW